MSAKVLREITTNLWACRCEYCGHKWESKGDEPPQFCAGCKRRHWNEKPGTVKRGRPTKEVVLAEVASRASGLIAGSPKERALADRSIGRAGRRIRRDE